MNRAIRAVGVSSIIALLSSGCLAQTQKTIITPDGRKEIFDASTGWMEIDKNGKIMHISVADLNSLCGSGLDTAMYWNVKDTASLKVTCDLWAQVQPHTTIEKVPFSSLIHRLVEISPPYTDFARYRGIELKSEGSDAVYDATIIPNDVGSNAVCTVVQGPDPSGGEFYEYTCSVRTSSYSDAITLEKILVQRLNGLGLTEDQVTEHGLVVRDKNDNECAPTGECTHSQMFSSMLKEYKFVEIVAEPDFIRNNTLGDLQMLTVTGRHNPPDGVKSDSGSVTFTVYSHSVGQSQ